MIEITYIINHNYSTIIVYDLNIIRYKYTKHNRFKERLYYEIINLFNRNLFNPGMLNLDMLHLLLDLFYWAEMAESIINDEFLNNDLSSFTSSSISYNVSTFLPGKFNIPRISRLLYSHWSRNPSPCLYNSLSSSWSPNFL